MAGTPGDSSFCDKVVLLLTSGTSLGRVEQFCTAQGLSAEDTVKVIEQAREKITLAADYSREEQLGEAIAQLKDLYSKSILAKDPRTALQARRELNRLMDLYGDNDEGADIGDGEAAKVIELIEGYLLPLELTDSDYPIQEHARVAADIIRQSKVRKKQTPVN